MTNEDLIQKLYDLFDEILHVSVEGLRMDAAEGIKPVDWKDYASDGMSLIEKYRKEQTT